MKTADGWRDYRVIATGDGYKLEDWKGVLLLRPDPQVIWPSGRDLDGFPGLNAKYVRSETGRPEENARGMDGLLPRPEISR